MGSTLCLGGNFLSAFPDTVTAAALRRCRLTAHVSTKLNRSHLITGDRALILPCLGRTEIDVKRRTSVCHDRKFDGRCANFARFAPARVGELLSEPQIVATCTRDARTSHDRQLGRARRDYDKIRDAIERVIPGFDDYNARVREPGGFYFRTPRATSLQHEVRQGAVYGPRVTGT